jgi:hypothetical protein
MVDAPPLEHDRAAAQWIAPIRQLPPQIMVAATIAELQIGNAAAQLAEGGEMVAEGTTAIEHQQRSALDQQRRMG